MIDLHTHTTASDGRCAPAELVARAAAAGVRVLGVTDHDTVGGCAAAAAACADRRIEFVAGIEITAVVAEADVHVLGYFIDIRHGALQRFLARQREVRIGRVEGIARRLGELGVHVDVGPAIAAAYRQPTHAIGRPQVARAMVEAGIVASITEAFDRWLGRGCPAFVDREGDSPETVISTIHAAGGLASLAHPARTRVDERIPVLRQAGLDALEAYHSDHDASVSQRYVDLAASLDLLVTGGSDFHGDPSRAIAPGSATLPLDAWARLAAARSRHA